MGRIIAAVIAGIILVASPGAALAQTSEQQSLGLQLAQQVFRALSLEDIIEKEAQSDADNFFDEVKSRPEWKGYLIAAMQEEIRHDMPAIEKMFGRALAASMTADELRIGVTLLKDPGMQEVLKAGAEGRETNTRPSREIERMMRTPAGLSFLGKLQSIDKTLEPMFEEFMIEILPGTLRRFADKAEAGEAARAR